MKRVIVIVAIAACSRGEHREAREKYNEGVAALVQSDFEAAEKALLDARSGAGVDPELRFRAAYDLGMAYAAHADKMKTGKDADLAKALELEQQAVSWFSDAARLRKDDKDTQANLAIVRARAQALADEINRGAGKLEARLDALIAEQRSVLDDARGAWLAIKQAGGADPLAQQGTLTHLADKERGVVAEAGVINDLAADEIETIGKKADDKRSEDEKVRVVQLKNLDLYLLEGRARIAEARRKLQDLAAEDAVGRAEAALVALKRAREQLLDPITVLREVAGEQLQLMQETQAVSENTTQAVPAWLDAPAMTERQNGLRDRVEEVRARIAAGTEQQPPADAKPEQVKAIERFKAALPHITDASAAMDRARTSLGAKKDKDAVLAERDALVALAKAIEQFADLKQTIDIASETQKQLVALLSPEGAKVPDRAAQSKDALDQNTARMGRIKDLLADETARLDQQKPPADAKDPKQAEAMKQQVEAMKQQMAEAERLRGEAEKAIGELAAAIKTNKDPLTPAKAADAKLDELRRIFFSVIEHLQDLIRQQGETRDQTSQADAEQDEERAPKLPGIAGREDQHAQLAKAITDVLAKQADAAGKQAAQPQPGAPDPKNLAAAADEVRLAQGAMTDAKAAVDKVIKTTNQSVSLKPAVTAEGTALEHLQNALKLLQPPPQQNKEQQKQDQQKQDQQKQDQQKQDQQKQDQQQQQQGGAGQRARDEDARRQREKQQREQAADTVDKDW